MEYFERIQFDPKTLLCNNIPEETLALLQESCDSTFLTPPSSPPENNVETKSSSPVSSAPKPPKKPPTSFDYQPYAEYGENWINETEMSELYERIGYSAVHESINHNLGSEDPLFPSAKSPSPLIGRDCLLTEPRLCISCRSSPEVEPCFKCKLQSKTKFIGPTDLHLSERRAQLDEEERKILNDIVCPNDILPFDRLPDFQPCSPSTDSSSRCSTPALEDSPKGLVTPDDSDDAEEIIDVETVENIAPVGSLQTALSQVSLPPAPRQAISLLARSGSVSASSAAATNRPMRSVLRPTSTLAAHRSREQAGYLPKTSSLCAQVAAMHNYSSTTGPSQSGSYSKGQRSSIQTTANVLSTIRNGERRFKPYPSPVGRRRKLNVPTESSLRTVSEKLGKMSKRNRVQDTVDSSKRAYHNVLERKRRNDLANSIQILRQQIPELASNDRAAKMTILQRGAKYCVKLCHDYERLTRALNKEEKRREELQRYLYRLKQRF